MVNSYNDLPYATTTTAVLWPCFWDCPGELVPQETYMSCFVFIVQKKFDHIVKHKLT